MTRSDLNTGRYVPYSLREVCGLKKSLDRFLVFLLTSLYHNFIFRGTWKSLPWSSDPGMNRRWVYGVVSTIFLSCVNNIMCCVNNINIKGATKRDQRGVAVVPRRRNDLKKTRTLQALKSQDKASTLYSKNVTLHRKTHHDAFPLNSQ